MYFNIKNSARINLFGMFQKSPKNYFKFINFRIYPILKTKKALINTEKLAQLNE